MLTQERFENIFHEVKNLDLLQGIHCLTTYPAGSVGGFEGNIEVQGRNITLQILLDNDFPISLPYYFVTPADSIGFIPHVDRRGWICYSDREGRAHDQRRPVQLIHETFIKAVEVLNLGLSGQNIGEFVDEFEVYWQRSPGVINVDSIIDPGPAASKIYVGISKKTGNVSFIGNEAEVSTYFNKRNIGKEFSFKPALYIPLEKGPPYIIPPSPERFWTLSQVRQNLMPAISPENLTIIRSLITDPKISKEYTLFSLPRPSGGTNLFGLKYYGVIGKHPFVEGGSAKMVTPIMPVKLNRSFLVQRGGGDNQLSNKRVLVIGCGAVGGYLIAQLVRAGILHFTIVDSDDLAPENTFRHILGRKYWNKAKAKAIKEELENQFPYLQITANISTIEQALHRKEINLENYDLIISAIGNPTVELEINNRIQMLKNSPPTIFTWLEPLGIGGHTLLTNNPAGEGCFQCLYTSTDETNDFLITNQSAFAAPNQMFGKALSGCGSLHTPYGSLDAEKTSLSAARLAVDVLLGKEKGNLLLSWKGDATAFEAEKILLSERFDLSEDTLWRNRYAYLNTRCKVCQLARVERSL